MNLLGMPFQASAMASARASARQQQMNAALNNAYVQMQPLTGIYDAPGRIIPINPDPSALHGWVNDKLTQREEEEEVLPKEKRPQGWKAAIIWIAFAVICWKMWQNRDEIVVKAEELGKELFNKLGLTPKEEAK